MLRKKKTVRMACAQQGVYEHGCIQQILKQVMESQRYKSRIISKFIWPFFVRNYIFTLYIPIYIRDIIYPFVALECYNIMPILVHHKRVFKLVHVYISSLCSSESNLLSPLQDYRFRRSIYS